MPIAESPRSPAPISLRLGFTGAVALVEAVHLATEHFAGGIANHHLLNDPTLPQIWNGWGLVVLPLLAWIASARAFERPAAHWRLHRAFVLRLAGALLAGIALATAFTSGSKDVAGALFPAIVLAGVALRAYRPEFVLGFALGMAFTVGGVLPVLIGGCIALVSAFVWLVAWPVLRHVTGIARRTAPGR